MYNYYSTLKDEVVKYVKQSIIKGELKPGDRIIPDRIAEKFNISRGPIREALNELTKENLVCISPYKGTFVTALAPKEVVELCSIRSLLESYAIQLALVNITEVDIQKMLHILDQMRSSAKESNVYDIIRLELEFHDILLKASKHDLLYKTWANTNVQVTALFMTLKSELNISLEEVVDRHSELLEPIQNKDVVKAQKAISDHYLTLSEKYSKLHESNEESKQYFKVVTNFFCGL